MDEPRSSKHKRSSEKDSESSSRKRVKHKHSSKKSKKKDERLQVMDDDPDDEDMWVEKNIDLDGEKVHLNTPIFLLEFLIGDRSLLQKYPPPSLWN